MTVVEGVRECGKKQLGTEKPRTRCPRSKQLEWRHLFLFLSHTFRDGSVVKLGANRTEAGNRAISQVATGLPRHRRGKCVVYSKEW